MKDQGLIIGIEYDKSVIQACVYDMRAGIPVACDEVSGLSIADAIRRILGRYNVDEIDSLCVKSGLSDIEELNKFTWDKREPVHDHRFYTKLCLLCVFTAERTV